MYTPASHHHPTPCPIPLSPSLCIDLHTHTHTCHLKVLFASCLSQLCHVLLATHPYFFLLSRLVRRVAPFVLPGFRVGCEEACCPQFDYAGVGWQSWSSCRHTHTPSSLPPSPSLPHSAKLSLVSIARKRTQRKRIAPYDRRRNSSSSLSPPHCDPPPHLLPSSLSQTRASVLFLPFPLFPVSSPLSVPPTLLSHTDCLGRVRGGRHYGRQREVCRKQEACCEDERHGKAPGRGRQVRSGCCAGEGGKGGGAERCCCCCRGVARRGRGGGGGGDGRRHEEGAAARGEGGGEERGGCAARSADLCVCNLFKEGTKMLSTPQPHTASQSRHRWCSASPSTPRTPPSLLRCSPSSSGR